MIEFPEKVLLAFDEYFLAFLEYQISRAFRKSQNKSLKYIWCDGIARPNAKAINETAVMTTAWVGESGQDVYLMTIQLGNCTISNIMKKVSLVDCVPSDDTTEWISIDVNNRTITLELN